MSVKRRDLIHYLQTHGFYLLREGSNHSIYTNAQKTIPDQNLESGIYSV
jgi:predicted RNA binding protein YcfA (HicA-like mRNA interferase family)